MNTVKKILKFSAAALILGAFIMGGILNGAWAAEKKVIKIGSIYSESHPASIAIAAMNEELKERSGGTLEIEYYGNSVLGDDVALVQQTSSGTLDVHLMLGFSAYNTWLPELGIEDLPFVFPDLETARKVYASGFGERVAKLVGDTLGVRILAVNWEGGQRHFTNNVRPIVVPADLKGLKMRVVQNEMRLKALEVLGANPIPMSFSELYTALQQGTVDAEENPLTVIDSSKFYEVQKYLSLCGYIYNSGFFEASKALMDRLTPEEGTLVTELAVKYGDYQRKLNDEQSAVLVDRMKEIGMEVNEVDIPAFMEAVKPAYDYYRENYGGELLDLALSLQN
ncbi:MAG: DctP family TRAP transporter solute-binding subunit [Synergistaceae bacterium]|jgi:tripartite ATP-independent transporter DctP family solute receptor|nr:DctP family TRAP transporter solute-binding subunit [Synergistaceae bacterium]